ncbi:MAG TPA: arabinan endo-1,5-alpha-L-arabinosidase [Chitinophaga sp.]|uniref:arabinan endo-1,5-alpha-L-arabinosidase n=1 Tax=Chitinophaga sp. TaxID=1869181 RepID=UPI002DBE45B4|nr:arabinan endo-1,5-alpha-L-arabinosidase [Chitinophaga sp.]HEU4552021.1 arabinan endo-1,5-alpha-L-arabinosidase [Chitinophaga sp.]
MRQYIAHITLVVREYERKRHRLCAGTLRTLFILVALPALAQTSIPAHDPVMIRQGNRYYMFCTGNGITVWSSPDRRHWEKEPPVFSAAPAWAAATIPGFRGHIWAPDISYHNGLYYLYYAVSAFGKNTSCIGVATNKTLDHTAPGFKWTDHGKVVQSVPGRDMWNAIDPNLVFDENNVPWLAFGSFWNGIKLVKLADSLTAMAKPEQWYSVAARTRTANIPDTLAGDAAIEAPFIFKKGGYYYLFVSFDYCCRGPASTYKIMVGRSKKLTGPYVDRNNIPMLQGGGTLVLQGNAQWYGVGHNAAYTWDGKDYIIFHGYDAADKGRAKLQVRELDWDKEGWPLVR